MLIFSRTFDWGSVISNSLLNCYKLFFSLLSLTPIFSIYVFVFCSLIPVSLVLPVDLRCPHWADLRVMSVGVICHITSSACSHCCICLRRQPGKENQITFTCPVIFSSKRLLWPCLCTKCVCVYTTLLYVQYVQVCATETTTT